MCRFYWIDVQPDLFGGFAVVKEWGRIGARGRMMDEWHMTEAKPTSPCSAKPNGNAGADIGESVQRTAGELR
jgi:predicted DNA-binding WGR domain protein